MNTDPQKQTIVPAESATKQERSVTVQVLTIGKRQVTQALYRQLVDENVIDQDTGNLKGEVWGWVNMHVGECNEKKPHLHVIWERDGSLRRACSYESWWESKHYSKLRSELVYLAEAYIAYIALSGKSFPNWKPGEKLFFTVNAIQISLLVPSTIVEWWSLLLRVKQLQKELEAEQTTPPNLRSRSLQTIQEELNQAQGEKRDFASERFLSDTLENALHHPHYPGGFAPSQESVYEQMKVRASELASIEQTWKQSYQTIQDAGQLFIAVSGVWK